MITQEHGHHHGHHKETGHGDFEEQNIKWNVVALP